MEEEIWKDVIGFEGKYQVSNLGNVRSLNYHGVGYIKNLKKQKGKDGYFYICLSKNGKLKNYAVHRLELEAFVPNKENLPQVNHKNEIKQDNRLENLEWCTRKYNINYGTGHYRSACKLIKKRAKPVRCIETNKVFRSINEAARSINDYPGTISNICNKKFGFHTAGDLHWEFITLEEYSALKNN